MWQEPQRPAPAPASVPGRCCDCDGGQPASLTARVDCSPSMQAAWSVLSPAQAACLQSRNGHGPRPEAPGWPTPHTAVRQPSCAENAPTSQTQRLPVANGIMRYTQPCTTTSQTQRLPAANGIMCRATWDAGQFPLSVAHGIAHRFVSVILGSRTAQLLSLV